LAVIGCGAPLGYGRGRFRRTAGSAEGRVVAVASGERGVVQCLRKVAGGVIDGDGPSLLEFVVPEAARADDDRRHPGLFAASTSHTESPIITLDASGGVPSFFSATCSRSGAGLDASTSALLPELASTSR